ncbi:hypothetical protein CDAR_618951 [Caerostris darwini]|uniref:Uncharacterized protein n=1 Tax=Caerostris darwini TaxID=1538125 RepID=A0AAV4QYI9_9ARAC|nr:hypothetical protein CDAR_618951 [Caerostris darwini]
MMSASGIAFAVITASLLKSILSSSLLSSTPAIFVEHDNSSQSTSTPSAILMTLQMPHLSEEMKDQKRQFDPWGGKKRSHQHKRQFSPWGGKRSPVSQLESSANRYARDASMKNSPKKRSFNPWSSKESIPAKIRNFSSWDGKRNFNSWGGKRSSLSGESKFSMQTYLAKRNAKHLNNIQLINPWAKKQSFNPWAGKRSFNPWAGKRAFNPWAGKRSFNPWAGKKSFNSWGGKKSFNSWGGKRSFSSWGGKRGFNSWGGKRTPQPEDNSIQKYDRNP